MDLSLTGVPSHIKEKANHPLATMLRVLFLGLNIAMLAVGIIKKDECPVNPRIPIYLIVAGAIGILSKLLPIVDYKHKSNVVNFMVSLLHLLEFICTIVGSVWVYQIYKPHFEVDYSVCNKLVYLMSFWVLTIHWVFVGLAIILTCYYCLANSESNADFN